MDSTATKVIIDRATIRAKELGVPACIAVFDGGAHLLSFLRMDGAILGAIDVAQRKARTAVLFPLATGEFGQLVADQHLMGMELSNGGLALFHGGLPSTEKGALTGAIGVSGGTADQDLEIARYALADMAPA